MAGVLELNEENFKAQVLESELPVMVDFAAAWCPPCRVLSPIVEQIAKEYEGKAVVGRVDVDKAPGLAREHRILSVPTVVFFNHGKAVETSTGAVPKQKLTDILDRLA